MKISDIRNFADIVKYCKYKECNKIYLSEWNENIFHPSHPSLPQSVLQDDIYLFYKYHNPSGSIGYRFLSHTMKLNNIKENQLIKGITGILYSYDTPIGLILENNNLVIVNKAEKFKVPSSNKNSVTTRKILTVLNQLYVGIDRKLLKQICKSLGIKDCGVL